LRQRHAFGGLCYLNATFMFGGVGQTTLSHPNRTDSKQVR